MGTVQDAAFAAIETKADAIRTALRKEVQEFTEHMKAHGFPGVERLDVTTGYKKGFRYLLTPKYAKEEHETVAGWVYRLEDLPDDNNKHSSSDPFAPLFAITAEGEIIEPYIWTEIWISGLSKLASIDALDGSVANNYRWYLAELRKKHG